MVNVALGCEGSPVGQRMVKGLTGGEESKTWNQKPGTFMILSLGISENSHIAHIGSDTRTVDA